MCGQIEDCVTTAGRWPEARGFAARSVSVYPARMLGLRGGTHTCQSNEGALLVQGSERCSGSDEYL